MKLICIGDSFTKGFGVKQRENWISQLDFKDLDIINMGINGDTTSGMLARFNTDVVSRSPNYALITGGMNDFIAGSGCEIPQNNYMAMVHQAFHHGIIPIVGIEPDFYPNQVRPDWRRFSDFDQVFDKQKRLRNWLINMCRIFGVFYIDFYERFKTASCTLADLDLYIDGLHLTADGHKIISKIAVNSLKGILTKSVAPFHSQQ